MEFRQNTGFLERAFFLLHHSAIQPELSAFLRRYGQRLFRIDNLDVAPPEVLHRLLLDTPIDLLVSNEILLHSWWKDMEEKGMIPQLKKK